MVWDGSAETHTQYVNGVVQTAIAGGSVDGPILGPDSGPWYIGYDDRCGDTRDFDGAIDDISVWNHTLSPREVTAIYENGLAGIGVPEPGSAALVFAGLACVLLKRVRR